MPPKRTVLVGGSFQLLHPGHLRLLEAAARLGSVTVVIAHDATVRRTKGLLVPAADRAKLVRALRCVDRAVIGHPRDFFKVVRRLRPDIILLGPDQEMPGLEAALRAARLECRVLRLRSRYKGYGTRRLLQRAQKIRKK